MRNPGIRGCVACPPRSASASGGANTSDLAAAEPAPLCGACPARGRGPSKSVVDGLRKRIPATVVPFPFYDPEKTRVRA